MGAGVGLLDYSYEAKPSNADIVIFGDSSAFLGIDPKQIDSELGTHTVVLPNTVGSLQVTGDLALRHYLALNRPPRAIVFYFTPWNLDFRHSSPPEFLFEGEEMLLRNGNLKEIASFAFHHPQAFLEFPYGLSCVSYVGHAVHGRHPLVSSALLDSGSFPSRLDSSALRCTLLC